MKKPLCLLIGLAMLLSGCRSSEIPFDLTPAATGVVPSPGPAITTLSLDSTLEEIQTAMRESAAQWNTIWMDGVVTWYDPTGSGKPPQVFHEQVWIDQTASRFRILLGPADAAAESFKVCDGTSILEMDLTNGQSQVRPLPDFAKSSQFVLTIEPGTAYPNQLWGQIGTPLSELVFSSDRAQNEGTFAPVAIESVAGRQVLVVEWTYVKNELPSFRAWLDVETAVILKIQEFGKGGGEEVHSERVVNQVEYDAFLGDDLFSLQFSEMPSFSDISGQPLATAEPAPTLSSGPDLLGYVYFFVADHVYGNETVKLMRLPGSCAASQVPCPEAETVATPFDLRFSLTPLVWAPDGKYAAFPYPVSEDGNSAKLFLFDPAEQTWQPLAEFSFIDPPVWSPDGDWLAFRVQDGQGGEDVYAVRRDGSDLTNMTASEKLPAEGRPYMLSGWINEDLILRSGNPDGGGLVYLRRVSDGFTKPLFEAPWNKSDLVPSPDGSMMAYSDGTEHQTVLKLLTREGRRLRDLAGFQRVSIYPIVWSPDGTRIAFAIAPFDVMDTRGQDVFLIDSDGRNIRQVHHSASAGINNLSFSPDGKYLLLPDMDATGQHIYTVDLSTLETQLLQAPGLPLDWWWLAPSWQP